MNPIEEDLREVDARLRVAEILGTAEERKDARLRLGITVRQMASMTGLDIRSIYWRETSDWRMTRGSLTSEGGQRYVRIVGRMRGML